MTDTMTAVRLHGPRDLRVERVPRPRAPGPGEALLRVTATGICGSDLHTYVDGRIGDWVVQTPLILGHEFGGVVEAVGPEAFDGSLAEYILMPAHCCFPVPDEIDNALPACAYARSFRPQRGLCRRSEQNHHHSIEWDYGSKPAPGRRRSRHDQHQSHCI